jgi:hypothetical protein
LCGCLLLRQPLGFEVERAVLEGDSAGFLASLG